MRAAGVCSAPRMETDPLKLWERYRERTTFHDEIGLTLDLSRVDFADDFFESHAEAVDAAFAVMANYLVLSMVPIRMLI